MHRWWALTLVAGLSLPRVVPAATAAPETTEAAASSPGGEHKAPDLFEWRADLAIWTVVVFLGLFFVLRRFAWGPMLGALQKREEGIRGAIQDARLAREEAERLQQQFQAQLDHAQDKVREILDEARRDAQRTTQDIMQQAQQEAQATRDRARREIERARDQALKEIVERTADLVTDTTRKIVQKNLDAADHRRLIEEALHELPVGGKS